MVKDSFANDVPFSFLLEISKTKKALFFFKFQITLFLLPKQNKKQKQPLLFHILPENGQNETGKIFVAFQHFFLSNATKSTITTKTRVDLHSLLFYFFENTQNKKRKHLSFFSKHEIDEIL